MKRILLGVLSLALMLTSIFPSASITVAAEELVKLTIHYQRNDDNYEGWNIWAFDTGTSDTDQIDFIAKDNFGYLAEIEVVKGQDMGFIIRKGDWEAKNCDDDQRITVEDNTEIWVTEGQCGYTTTSPGEAGERTELELEQPAAENMITDEEADMQVYLHYRRYDENYDDWNVWGWLEGSEGTGYPFTEVDDYGVISKINLKDIDDATNLGIILRKGDWEAKDGDSDRFIDLSTAITETDKKVLHVYLLEGDETIYTDVNDVDLTPQLSLASFTEMNKIMVSASIPFKSTDDKDKEFNVVNSKGNSLEISEVIFNDSNTKAAILLDEEISFQESYTISNADYKDSLTITFDGLFDSDAFHEEYYYDGDDLGFTYGTEQTDFRVWAPTASNVSLNLYSEGSGDNLIETIPMTRDIKGTWITSVSGNQNLTYYTYTVTVGNQTNEAVDPYARAVGVNGDRAMVLDLETTNPEKWTEDVSPEFSGAPSDAVIYELHMRDLSSHESSGISNVGKYLQFTEHGTTSPDGESTGLDHLKELGFTHLHLLPAFDHRSIDETRLDEPQFNWGYDPQHYNVPEGSYSTDPTKGEIRINEFKQMIQSLHDNGIRVVMDVVYNHTGATADSDFNKIVPGYYYRQDSNGGFANGSGCGNETASDRSMMQKYIVDSVSYWVEEYHVDGFRFDLMALHDIDTMNLVHDTLKAIDPSLIIYGEGWNAGGSVLPETEGAFKKYATLMPGISMFSDDIRDGIKGSVFDELDPGFVNGKLTMDERIKFGIVGATDHPQLDMKRVSLAGGSEGAWAAAPGQSVNYASAHDNHTLYDKLLITNPNANEETIALMQKQANAIVLTSQGMPFLHAGVEMLRTKDGNHNSYNAADEVNQIDWSWKSTHKDIVDYHSGLIALRSSHPAFRMKTTDEVSKNLVFFDEVPVGVIGYNIGNHANGDTASDITVIHNASEDTQTISLPKEGNWQLVVNESVASIQPIKTIKGNSVEVPAHTSYVLMLDETLTHSSIAGPIIIGIISCGIISTIYGIYTVKKKKKA